MDQVNAQVHRLGYGHLYKMPLDWKDQHTTYWKDKMLGASIHSLPLALLE